MSPTESIHTAAEVAQVLLLVWVHGFKGNQATFADFPDDVGIAAKERFTLYDVRSIIYPKYRTVGELDTATGAFVSWLYKYVLDLERELVDKASKEAHTTVILLGHSMGGMLVADAAKAVWDDKKRRPDRIQADVRGIIGIDTPYIGIHPALVSYGMEQIDAFIDKTLLDTAAFFENSPKFLKKGMSKMGIRTDRLKSPPVPDGRVSPTGRLEKGFTTVLALPGVASSTEYDWTSKERGGGWKGLRRAWSAASQSSSVSTDTAHERDDGSSLGMVLSRQGSVVSIPPPLPPRQGSIASTRQGSGGSTRPPLPPRPSRQGPESASGSSAGAAQTGSKGSGDPVDQPAEAVPGPADIAAPHSSGPTTHQPHREESTGSSVAPDIVVTPSVDPGPEPLVEPKASGSPPSTTFPSDDLPTPSDPSPVLVDPDQPQSTSPGDSPPSPTAADATTALARKKQQKKDWKWARAHMEFMSSCWNVSGILKRMKTIETMQRDGMYFVNIYTIVQSTSRVGPREKTFVSLPTIHRPTKESWKPFIHDSAVDQVEAHMALFNKAKHKGYGRLIGVIGDEIGEVLRRVEA